MARVPQQDRSRETRERLLSATLDLLCTSGVASVTVSGIAQKAGVSRGAAQHHFANREELIRAAMEHFFIERTHQLRLAIAEVQPNEPDEEIRAVLDLIISFHVHPLYHAAVHIWSAAASDSSLREIIVPAETRHNREVFQLMAVALNADLRDANTRHLLGMTLDMARGLGLASVLLDNPEHRRNVIEWWSNILRDIKRSS